MKDLVKTKYMIIPTLTSAFIFFEYSLLLFGHISMSYQLSQYNYQLVILCLSI